MLLLVWWPTLISALLYAGQLRLSKALPRLGEVKAGPVGASNEAYHAMFAIAHHDIWWAKEHAWTIVTYVIGVVVTLVVVDMKDLLDSERQALGLLYFLTGVLALIYTGRMQSDMAAARIRSAFLVRHTKGLGPLVTHLVKEDRDYYRGAFFMLTLALLSSGVSAIAVAVILKNRELGWIAYGVLGILALCSLHLQVRSRAVEAMKDLFLPAAKA